jgi:hypothetical protein
MWRGRRWLIVLSIRQRRLRWSTLLNRHILMTRMIQKTRQFRWLQAVLVIQKVPVIRCVLRIRNALQKVPLICCIPVIRGVLVIW